MENMNFDTELLTKEERKEDMDYAEYFDSFNNAFGLSPEDHDMSLKDVCKTENEYYDNSDDLIKAFASISPPVLPSDSKDERDCNLLSYIYSYQSLLNANTPRVRSASAPIPSEKRHDEKSPYEHYDLKWTCAEINSANSSRPQWPKQLSLELQGNEYSEASATFICHPRSRALTLPLSEPSISRGISFNNALDETHKI